MSTTTSTTAAAGPLPVEPGRWVIDPHHTTVGFTIRHLGISKVRGRFAEVDAELVVGSSLADTKVTATVQLASVDTGNADRDTHIRAPDMLDVARRPEMRFVSSSVTDLGDGDYRLDGKLTIGEVRRPFALQTSFGGAEPFPGGPVHAGFEARGSLKRSDFGLDLSLPPGVGSALLADSVAIELDLQFVAAEG